MIIIIYNNNNYNYIPYCMGQRSIWRNIVRVCKAFSRAAGEGKYFTRMQCLAILTANPCNERFIIHFFDHVSERVTDFRAMQCLL